MNLTKQKSVIIAVLFSGILFFPFFGHASPLVSIEMPSSPNPVGSGARALGMGGAFIAIADDATAASWNPGGLSQLHRASEISAVFGYVHRSENNHVADDPESSGKQFIHDTDLNYLSATHPFMFLNRNTVVSLNYQRLYDFNREWNTDDSSYRQQGDLYALGLALCSEIIPDFSVGITLNDWGNTFSENKWKQTYHVVEHISYKGYQATVLKDKTEEYAFKGWNANIGFLWEIGNKWKIGGVFKTPFTADIEHDVRGDYTTIYPASTSSYNTDINSDDRLRMPMSYGIGIAYRILDNFIISADVYRTHWNQFELQAYGENVSPISGKKSDVSHIDPTTWLRLGGEYMIEAKEFHIPIRAGIFYDPAPAEDSPDNYYGFSLGTGINCKPKGYSLDIAYQFRFGNDVGSSMFQDIGFSQDVREHTIYMSLIYYF